MGPQRSERGVKIHLSFPFQCATAIQSDSFPLHPIKSPRGEDISDSEEIISGQQRFHTAYRGCFQALQVQRTFISAERSSRSSWPVQLLEDSPMRRPSRLVVPS